MPQTIPERAARWPGGDQQAMTHLASRGFRMPHDGRWTYHHPTLTWETMSERDRDAIIYLAEEWDFGGFEEGA